MSLRSRDLMRDVLKNLIAVKCSHCQSEDVIRSGKSSIGKQRFRCLNSECPYQTFSLDSAYPGRKREMKQQILDMKLNGSGVRDIQSVLCVSTARVSQQPDFEAIRDRILSSWRVAKRSESKERIKEALDRFIAELEIDE